MLKNKSLYYLLIVMGLALFLLIRSKYHFSSLETDTGHYGYGAQEILRGNLPYESFHINKPPGILYIYAFVLKFFGSNSVAIKAAATVFLFFGAVLVYLTSRSILTKYASLGVLLFYLLAISLPYIQTIHANTEAFMVTFLALSSYLILRMDRKKYLILSGFSLGVAALIKPVVVANWLAFVVWFFFTDRKNFLKKSLTLSLSAAFPILLMVIYFLQKGIFDEFWFFLVKFNIDYINSTPLLLRPFLFNPYVVFENPALWIFGISGVIYSFFRPHKKMMLISLQILLPLMLIIYSGKNWGHYYIQVVPFLSIASIYFIVKNTLAQKKLFFVAFILLVGFSVLFLFNFAVPTPANKLITKARPGERGDWYDQNIYVAEYVKKHTEPGDYIYNLGREGQIYFYTQTRSPSRFLFDRAFYYFPETLKEACEDLAANKPKLIVNTLKEPYFSEEWAEYVWNGLKKCGNLEIEKKEEVYFAEIWFLK